MKIRLMVMDECILGYHIPGSALFNILHSSVLKGATSTTPIPEPKLMDEKRCRLATKKDFEEFRVLFTGYENDPDFEYQK